MKEYFKTILKKIGLYYFLQGNYRRLLFFAKKIRCRIIYKKYKNIGFECNVCHARYSRFVPDHPSAENKQALAANEVIAGYGENILCPSCLSTARERLIIALLQDQFILTGKNILHFSPEKNILSTLRKNNKVITADLEPGFYKIIDEKIKNENATRLSFPDNSFDMVIGNHIMEHIPEDGKAMTEIHRVLKPGGRAILQIPYSVTISHTVEEPGINDPQKQSALFGQKDHIRIYQLQDYLNRLTRSGFTVSLIDYKDLKDYYKYAIQENEAFISILK